MGCAWRGRKENDSHRIGQRIQAVDTGQMYENEDIVGQAVKESGLERKEVFLTTKLYRPCVTYEKAKAAIEKSLQALQIGLY